MTDITQTFPLGASAYIIAWNLEAGRTNPISLHVWRPLGGSSYQLVGQTEFTPSTTGVHHVTLATADWILIKPGDTLGGAWKSQGVIVFKKISGTCDSSRYLQQKLIPSGGLNNGDEFTFSAVVGHCRIYLFNAECIYLYSHSIALNALKQSGKLPTAVTEKVTTHHTKTGHSYHWWYHHGSRKKPKCTICFFCYHRW